MRQKLKFRLLLLLLYTCTRLLSQDNLSLTELGIKNFLAGDFEKSIQLYTDAIKNDSMAYENYYFRAIALTYTSRDTSSLDDFFKSIELKRNYPRQTDTIFNGMLGKPRHQSIIDGSTFLHQQSDSFFDIMLSTWYFLNSDRNEACKILNSAGLNKSVKLKKIKRKYCNL